jgi:diadenosine tetraphosphate (Ap4A) HIT family hydrolase
VKPRRHVLHVGELTDGEAAELGPLLRDAAAAVQELTSASQVYVCLWSHANAEPVHIHFVVQPVMREQRERHGGGAKVQVAMFDANVMPPRDEVEAFAARARAWFGN